MAAPTTNSVLDAILARLEAAQWTPPGGSATSAFNAVKFYDDANPLRALAELLENRNSRVAAVYYEGDDFETDANTAPGAIAQRIVHLVTIYLADACWSGRDPLATRGGATPSGVKFPGALLLKDTVVNALAGKLAPGAACQLEHVRSLVLEQDDAQKRAGRDAQSPLGRKAVSLQFRVLGPWLTGSTNA